MARTENYSGNIYGVGFDPRKLGFSDSMVTQFDTLQFPRFNLGTYSELGTAPASVDISDTWSLQPNVNWVRGKHVMKIGTELRLYNQNNIGPGYASRELHFQPRFHAGERATCRCQLRQRVRQLPAGESGQRIG